MLLGVDLFVTNYPSLLTEHGLALVVPLDAPFAAAPAEALVDPEKLNLRDPVYVLDKRPLLQGCQCDACANHSRAYVHHLLNTEEMLGDVLLSIHNTHHWLAFFSAARRMIAEGTLARYADALRAALR